MKKILVKGPALSASGYGEQTRFALRALRQNEQHFDIFLQNISWGQTGMIAFDDEDRQWIDHLIGKTHAFLQQGGIFDISLQITIPNEFDSKLAPYNVGYTAGIETTKIAPEWLNPCNEMDKLIVISNHAKYGLANTTYKAKNNATGEVREFGVETPIEVIHYPVREYEEAPLDIELSTEFNFLSVCQWGIRKNLEATLVSFLEEFAEDDDVGLVLKTNIARNNIMDRLSCESRIKELLSNFPDKKCKVYLLHGNLTPEELTSLYRHPKIKAMVSTTHGEGFGLPLFEAAYNGLPIMAPNWSGHVDFLYAPVFDKKKKKTRLRPHFVKIDYDLQQVQPQAVWQGVIVPDSRWCYVKKFSVKRGMREMHKNIQEKQGIAKRLKNHILENFKAEEIYDQFADAVYTFDEEWENEIDEIQEA